MRAHDHLYYELIVACTVKCGHGWQLPERAWPDHRIVIVRGGCGELRHRGNRVALRRGSVVFGLPGEIYSIAQEPRRRLAISALRFQTKPKAVLSDFRPSICMQPKCFPLLEQLAIQQTRAVPHVPCTACGLNESLLTSLLWLIREDRAIDEDAALPALAFQELKPALESLQGDGRPEQKISALARSCGLSPGTFRRRMHALFKQSPKQYLLRRRIDRAKSMLLESAYTVEAIALALGYGETAHFSRQFKQHTGLTPRYFRASYQ